MKPSRIRYRVICVTTLMSMMLYLHRYYLTIVERFLKEDLLLTNKQIGLLFGTFFLAYGIGQVPCGWFSDRFGARWTLAAFIFLWSTMTGLMSVAVGFAMVVAFRFGCGLMQAGAYPTSAGIVSKWVPFSSRGRGSAVIAAGGRLGGFAAPVLTAYLLVAFVPVTHSSLLQSGDLMDVPSFVEQITKQGDEDLARGQLSRTILDHLPPATVVAVRSGQVEGTELTEGLNTILRSRDLYPGAERVFDLPGEAKTLIKIPVEERSSDQVARLHRLLLETAYPDAVRKVYTHGWRPVTWLYGAMGAFVALLFWWVIRDRPRVHPEVNEAEIALIERDSVAPQEAGALPWRQILTNRSLWWFSLNTVTLNFGWGFFGLWFARYLAEVHGVDVVTRGWMLSILFATAFAGMLTGGVLTDWLTRKIGIRWGRRVPLALATTVAMGGFVACTMLDSPWAITGALAVMTFSVDLGVPAIWALDQDIGGRYAGSVLGWTNMWGCVGVAIASVALERIIAHYGWNATFLACAASFLVAALATFGIDPTNRIKDNPQ